MAVTESKIKSGTLTIGGESFSCQPTNVRVVPKFDESGDVVETLCGDVLGADETESHTLNITAVQDFTDPAGLQRYSWEHSGQSVPFVWSTGADGVSFAGTVKVRALEVGGDVNKRLTVDAEWPCVGVPVPTWPDPAP